MNLEKSRAYYTTYIKKNKYPFIRKSGILIANFVFQDFHSLDKTEMKYKISFEFVIIIILSSLFGIKFIFSFIVAHFLNYICNSNIHCVRKLYKGTETDFNKFIEYLNTISTNASVINGILGIAVYGGVSEGRINKHSDIDVKIIRKSGLINGVLVCLYLFKERFKAMLSGFPLDISLLDDIRNYDVAKKNEIPLVIYDPQNILVDFYAKYHILDHVFLEKLTNSFYDHDVTKQRR